MDQTVLVEQDIDVGREAIEAFDDLGPAAPCVFWFYFSETTQWRLVVATPVFDQAGPKAAYSAIAKTLDDRGLRDRLSLRRVSAKGTQDRIVNLLRSVVQTKGPGISGIRFTNNVVNGEFIDDAYIYRMQ